MLSGSALWLDWPQREPEAGMAAGRLSSPSSKLRLTQAAQASRDTSVSALREELGVSKTAPYRNLTPMVS
jgi:hypothetical protein